MKKIIPTENGFTPHARGSTPCSKRFGPTVCVYPACAGIDRAAAGYDSRQQRLPRMRGDRPYFLRCRGLISRFTPHARGSTLLNIRKKSLSKVYPACAGIDRIPSRRRRLNTCLPRMRGDRPCFKNIVFFQCLFTPHARGSTLW